MKAGFMGELAESFFRWNNSVILWTAGCVGGVIFLYLIFDALRHRQKKKKTTNHLHYTATGRAEEWSRQHPEETDSNSSRKASKRKEP